VWPEGFGKLRTLRDHFWSRIHDLLACSIVPQPHTPNNRNSNDVNKHKKREKTGDEEEEGQ
jgi:hypothetical protein